MPIFPPYLSPRPSTTRLRWYYANYETTMVLRQFLDGDEPKPMFAAFFFYPDRLIAGDVQIRGPRHFHCCLYHENDLQYLEKVIQGSHMVSGDRCPACSDQLKKWSDSRAAAQKDPCPVGYRGEFPYLKQSSLILNGNFMSLPLVINIPCYSTGISKFFHLFVNFQWEIGILLSFCNFFYIIQWKFEAWEAWEGQTDKQTDG